MSELQDLIAGFKTIPTATIANALDDVGKVVNSSPFIRAVVPGMTLCGPAVTVDVESGQAGTFSSSDFKVGTLIDAASPGDVIVVSAKAARASIWGGMASLAASIKGVAGLVVDGSVRDVDEMSEYEFNVFSRHVIPTTGRSRLGVKSIGELVMIDGVEVAFGDIVVGDSTGIVVIPRNQASRVLQNALVYQMQDREAEQEIRTGSSFTEVMSKFKRI